MPPVPDKCRAQWGHLPLPESFAKSRADTSALWYKTVLSVPEPDLAGDIVVPEGLDFASHISDPYIDLEHARDSSVGDRPVAWARESLGEPGAPYAVEYKALNFGTDKEPVVISVPIGTEFYDPTDRISMQVFAMREQDALPSASIEFRPIAGFYKALGPSPLENRPAYRFDRADVVRWTVCREGVCPHAKTIQKATQVPSPLAKILRDNRVNVGGRWEPLHAVIAKALQQAPAVPSRTTVRVERKAMDDEYTDDADLDTTAQTAVEDEMPAEDTADGPTPTAQAAYDLSQGAKDLCQQIKDAASKGEHKPGRKKLMALCEKLDTISEMAMAVGKQVDADLSDNDELDGSEPDGDEEPAVTADDMEPDDDDGVLKGIPQTYKKAVKRFKLADLSAAPAATEAPATGPDPSELKALRDLVADLRKKVNFLS